MRSRFAHARWKPRANPAAASMPCITRLRKPSSAFASGWRCTSEKSSTAISAAATGSTSPASAPPSISRRGWRRSPGLCIAPSWRPKALPAYAPAAGAISANFRSQDSRRPSGFTGGPMKRHKPRSPDGAKGNPGRSPRLISFPDFASRHPGYAFVSDPNSGSECQPLFLRLGGEQQRIALGATGVGGARRLGLGDVLGEHGDHADAALVRGDHDLVGLVLGHAEFRLQDGDDEFAGRVIVVDTDDLVKGRPR